MVTQSIVVFVVRDDNPKKIRGWADLVKPGIEVITPNPLTSGGARWNIMAAYGAQRKQGKTHKQAVAYLNRLIRHVPVMDKSAREALQTFAGGKGDVLITYENEAIFANKKGVRTDFVRPRETILMDHPIAVTRTGQRKAGARVPPLPVHAGSAADLRGERLPAGREERAPPDGIPEPEGHVQDRLRRRVAEGAEAVLQPA